MHKTKGNDTLIYPNQLFYTWDHANRLTRIVDTGTSGTPGTATPRTINYLYDHAGQRVRKVSGTSTTLYPNKYFEVEGEIIIMYIWANDQLVSVVTKNNTSSSTKYIHKDHLGSTKVITDARGNVASLFNYTPFGEELILKNSSSADRHFIGERFDEETQMSYLNARYYEGSRGQFLSQDPIFWAIPIDLLADPQQLNSYSYARNNPLIYKDPLGLYNVKTGAVEKGDTLSQIRNIINGANGTSYSVSQLSKLNNVSNPDRIYVGQTIKPNNSTPDITRALSNVNQVHGAQAQGLVVAGSGFSNSTAPVKGGAGTIEFANKFRPGGDWDLKSQSVEGGIFCQQRSCGGQRAESYIFNAEEIPGDAPGNIHYGYVGKRAGYSESTLLFFGGVVQTLSHPGQFGDPASDKAFIRQGYVLNY